MLDDDLVHRRDLAVFDDKIVPAALNFVMDDRHIGGGAGDKHLLLLSVTAELPYKNAGWIMNLYKQMPASAQSYRQCRKFHFWNILKLPT